LGYFLSCVSSIYLAFFWCFQMFPSCLCIWMTSDLSCCMIMIEDAGNHENATWMNNFSVSLLSSWYGSMQDQIQT
jgi:hypothetical protein